MGAPLFGYFEATTLFSAGLSDSFVIEAAGLEAFAAAQSDPGLTRFGYNESIVSYSSVAVDELASEAMKSWR